MAHSVRSIRTRTNMTLKLSLAEAPSLLKPGTRVYLPGGPAEPTPLLDVLAAAGERLSGVTFFGAWMPGINRRDPTAWHEGACAETYFVGADLRAGFAAGRTAYVPLPYRLVHERIASGPRADIAFVPVTLAAGGRYSLGLNADFGAAASGNATCRVAVLNPDMPCPEDGVVLDASAFTHVLEAPSALLTAPAERNSPVMDRIARRVAALIDDGDTLEFGIGALPAATLSTLKGHRRLKIHSGMVTEGVLGLLEAGAMADAPGAVTTGFVWGSDAFYAAARAAPFRFRPVSFTHDHGVLAAIGGFVAVNAVLEVDLLGQANADILGTEQISGVGGLQDFVRGARASRSGRTIVALASTAQGGTKSRIVPALATPATLSRYDTDIVVTEHGLARLGGLGIDARAEALIAIADPAFRPALEAAWARARSAM